MSWYSPDPRLTKICKDIFSHKEKDYDSEEPVYVTYEEMRRLQSTYKEVVGVELKKPVYRLRQVLVKD